MNFDQGIYPEFVASRMKNMITHYGNEFFKDKTVLELGCGYGQAGKILENLGAKVTSSDVRKEHLEIVKKRYPDRNVVVIDCNKDQIEGNYDLVFALGLLYHLENPLNLITSAAKVTNNLCLCSIVLDTNMDTAKLFPADMSFDQSITNKCLIASPTWIMNRMEESGFKVEDISSDIANIKGNEFEWYPMGTELYHRNGNYLRRMFAGKK